MNLDNCSMALSMQPVPCHRVGAAAEVAYESVDAETRLPEGPGDGKGQLASFCDADAIRTRPAAAQGSSSGARIQGAGAGCGCPLASIQMNPSRLGILTCGRLRAFISSASPMMPLRCRR